MNVKEIDAEYLNHAQTGFFSKLNVAYLADKKDLAPFYRYRPDENGLKAAMEERARFPVNRAVLVDCLKDQYAALNTSDQVLNNIELLRKENTFTICTAHQPNLMSGYLYFFYKIIHAIQLAKHLKENYPEKNFVPVFYMGSEDDDLDELGVFKFRGKSYRWDTSQTGAVGRMFTRDLYPVLELLKQHLGSSPNAEQLKQIITEAYEGQKTIADATRYLINAFLGKYGIIVLDADHKALKEQFLPVIQQELFDPKAKSIVEETSQKLDQEYKAQAYCRPINLFYLKENLRKRIEYEGNQWKVVDTSIVWQTKEEMEKEIKTYPERFSPNVILRGLYQETILPNIAFIGGGSEVAYWMQLKALFAFYDIFFPCLILRQSALWMNGKESELQQKLSLSNQELFIKEQALQKHLILRQADNGVGLAAEKEIIEQALKDVEHKAEKIDRTLKDSVAASLKKMDHQMSILERKMIKAEKRNRSVEMNRISDLKKHLFPNDSLQERYDTFLPFYLEYGDEFFNILLENTLAFGNQFLLLKSR